MKITPIDLLPDLPVSHNPEIKKKVFLKKGEIPAITNFSRAVFLPGQRAIAHSHPTMYEIFYPLAGRGSIVINGSEYSLSPGSCVLVEPKEVHELINTGEDDLILMVVGVASIPD